MTLRLSAFLLLADASLIAMHPDPSVREQAAIPNRPRPTLGQLLARQIARREQVALRGMTTGVDNPVTDLASLSPVDLHRRRANLRQMAARQAQRRSLPRLWRELADLTARPLEQLIDHLGLDLISAGARGASKRRIELWFARLGPTHAPRVLRRLAMPPVGTEIDPTESIALKSFVQTLMERDARSAEALIRAAGCSGIATLYSRLSIEHRDALAGCCRSTIVNLLSGARFALADDVHCAYVERWLAGTLVTERQNRPSDA